MPEEVCRDGIASGTQHCQIGVRLQCLLIPRYGIRSRPRLLAQLAFIESTIVETRMLGKVLLLSRETQANCPNGHKAKHSSGTVELSLTCASVF